MHAWETVAGAEIAAVVVRIAACCVVVRVETAVVALATCVMEGSRDLGSAEHPGASLQGPCWKRSCLEACQCLVDDDASGPDGVECVAEPWAKAPCCSGAWVAGGRLGRSSTVRVFVASVLACHTGFPAY
jgi:hypothetical protein